MQWHNDGVANAVSAVKEAKKFLLVLVRDDTERSESFKSILENSQSIKEILDKCICIEIIEPSIEYQQFTTYYKVDELPAIILISFDGILLETINGDFNDEELLNKLSDGISKFEHSEQATNSCTDKLNSNDTVLDQEGNADMQKRISDVQLRLEEKRNQKLQGEKEKERLDEINRRELGKHITNLKMTKKEMEDKELKDEMRRNKLEEKEAREKILRQIEEDKKERKERFSNQIQPSTSKPTAENEIRQRNPIQSSDGACRLQFRFPDGSTVNNKFGSSDTFDKAVSFVQHHVDSTYGSNFKFEIKQFFPRKTLNSDDYHKTLEQLELMPSASFAINFINKAPKPLANATSVTQSGLQVSTVTSWLFYPFNLLFSMINSIFQWTQSRWTNRGTPTTSQPNDSAERQMTWEERQRRILAAESRNIKKDGNMATFSDSKPSSPKDKKDDDEARWNGNSTQQM